MDSAHVWSKDLERWSTYYLNIASVFQKENESERERGRKEAVKDIEPVIKCSSESDNWPGLPDCPGLAL